MEAVTEQLREAIGETYQEWQDEDIDECYKKCVLRYLHDISVTLVEILKTCK